MTNKKDYEAIAKIIKNSYFEEDPSIVNKDRLVEGFSDYFERSNPRFDRDKFYEACYKKE